MIGMGILTQRLSALVVQLLRGAAGVYFGLFVVSGDARKRPDPATQTKADFREARALMREMSGESRRDAERIYTARTGIVT
jgi:hypothetical protein